MSKEKIKNLVFSQNCNYFQFPIIDKDEPDKCPKSDDFLRKTLILPGHF